MLPQFDLWCQFCSVIACDPQYEVGGDKVSVFLCAGASFPCGLHSLLLDRQCFLSSKQAKPPKLRVTMRGFIYNEQQRSFKCSHL